MQFSSRSNSIQKFQTFGRYDIFSDIPITLNSFEFTYNWIWTQWQLVTQMKKLISRISIRLHESRAQIPNIELFDFLSLDY